MKKRYDGEGSIEALAALPDDQIDADEMPELDDAFWRDATLVQPEGTEQATLRVRKSVLQSFRARARATGPA